eukprot:CAMPEP_0197034766 /NCGR_PEP_ID=MMETSP1384-20130603/12753_1 /TAXON_ID=29189 /ORGANISM="Ammonia sp." /LENGTH=562 /DNA_ID=CAMNT_0042464721 /DNA_START=20 /DNA_END=1708 /DNA_ORIENTATION=-
MDTATWLILSLIGLTTILSVSSSSSLPNIVLILTDDEDVVLSEDYITKYNIMPRRDEIFKLNGVQFNNAFSSSPTCCVSRSSILSGKYVHNHGVTNNTSDGNCWGLQWQQTQEPFSYASYLHDIGYNTFFGGKYLNRYTDATVIPRGWNDWHALMGSIDYYNYHLSNNGVKTFYDDSQSANYHTTVLKNFALDFLSDHQANNQDAPFLLVFSTVAAHSPFTVEDKYLADVEAVDITAPRTPNWNKVDGLDDHHSLIQTQFGMTTKQIEESDWIFKHRLFTLKSVDDAIDEIYDYIGTQMTETTLDDTYFIYASDHGFHSGQFGMGFAKMQLYETDIRIPFFVANSGDDVRKGVAVDAMANNIDIAPTILDIAGIDYAAVAQMDGKSLLPLVWQQDDEVEDDEEDDAFSMFLVEYHGEGYTHYEYRECDSHVDGFDGSLCDAWNNTYTCLRWIDERSDADFMYCNFKCFTEGRVETECEEKYSSVEAKGEYYDLNEDPWQMTNIWNTLSEQQVQYFNGKLLEFRSCSGDECRRLLRSNDIPNGEVENESRFYDFSRIFAWMTV